jgi:hypothetical protein
MNEEAGIGRTLDQVHDALRLSSLSYEVVIVDTNSTDGTVGIALGKGARVAPEPRRGYGRAYKTGFGHARGRIIGTLDADATYPADRIPGLVRMLDERGLDFITGDRISQLRPGIMSFKHRFGNRILTLALRILFGIRIRDSQSGMWVFRRAALPGWSLTADGMAYSEEIKIEAFRKSKAAEVPIDYRERLGQVKLSSFRDGFANLRFLFRKRFSRRRGQ